MRIVLAIVLSLAATPATAAAQTPADTARALHLLERATWGARPGDLAEVLRAGPEAGLEAQLQPSGSRTTAPMPASRSFPPP